MVDTELPKSNVLLTVGSSIVLSVCCMWAIQTHFYRTTLEITQREFDRIHARLNMLESRSTHWDGKPIPLTRGEDR